MTLLFVCDIINLLYLIIYISRIFIKHIVAYKNGRKGNLHGKERFCEGKLRFII